MRTSRVTRTLSRLARFPAVADRRGLRWLLNGRVMPGGSIALLVHRGRLTGRSYTTPVEVMVEDHKQGEIVVTPVRGQRSDWYRNLVAGGLVAVRHRGVSTAAAWRTLDEEECRDVLAEYQRRHPLWARMILSGMARQHGVRGDRIEGLAKTASLVAVRPSTDPI